MDYFEGVVADYLSADRAMFVNPQCRIQLAPGDTPRKGEHWYCDILAINLREKRVYLCEVTLSRSVATLYKRLREWDAHWPEIRAGLVRDCGVDPEWQVQPWVFVPESQMELVERRVRRLPERDGAADQMPMPVVTSLESVTPWLYTTPRQPIDLDGSQLT
jgi:hypothetical protein